MEKPKKVVHVYVAKKTVKPLFEKGDVFVECFDRPNAICPETADGMGGYLDLSIMEKYGGWIKYFYINNSINVKATRYYKKVLEHLNLEKETLNEEILALKYYLKQKENRLQKINDLLMIDENEPNEI